SLSGSQESSTAPQPRQRTRYSSIALSVWLRYPECPIYVFVLHSQAALIVFAKDSPNVATVVLITAVGCLLNASATLFSRPGFSLPVRLGPLFWSPGWVGLLHPESLFSRRRFHRTVFNKVALFVAKKTLWLGGRPLLGSNILPPSLEWLSFSYHSHQGSGRFPRFPALSEWRPQRIPISRSRNLGSIDSMKRELASVSLTSTQRAKAERNSFRSSLPGLLGFITWCNSSAKPSISILDRLSSLDEELCPSIPLFRCNLGILLRCYQCKRAIAHLADRIRSRPK
ncbi:hypothetical protein IE077_001659, partial [Cardiosporidium cionae]